MRNMQGARAKSMVFHKFVGDNGGEIGELGAIEDILRSADNEDLNKFRIGTSLLARKIEKALDIGRNELRIQDPHKVYGTLRELVGAVVDRHTASAKGCTITEVYCRLTELMKSSGEKEMSSFRNLFDVCDGTELLWIFAIMTKSVVSALDWNSGALRDLLKPGGNEEYKKNRDMKRADSETEKGFPLMCNFEPMLLARLDMDDWYGKIKKYSGENFFMELKFDGEHVVIHKRGSEWRVVTRNGKDFTKYYDGSGGRKNILSMIKPFFRSDVENCVIDCELMLFDEIANDFVRHHQKTADGKTYNFQNIFEHDPVHLVVVMLDVLLLNEHNFMGTPTDKRIKALDTLILKKQQANCIYVPERKVGNTSEDVEVFFNSAMASGHEGIVIKRKDTTYHPGKRLNRNGWFKVKANLTDGAHLDVAVVGVKYEGTKREQQFLIAVRRTQGSEEDDGSFELQVVGSVASGLTVKERQWLLEEGTRFGPLQPHAPSAVRGHQVKQGGYFQDWEDMKVVEIRCAGKQNFSLQHASLVRIRIDKDIHRVDTLHDFNQMEQRIRLGGLPALDQKAKDTVTVGQRKRKENVVAITKAKLAKESVLPLVDRGSTSWQLKDATVFIIPGKSDKRAKLLLEAMRGFGARVKAVPDSSTSFLIAETASSSQTKKRIREEKWTIIDGKWVERCEKERKIVNWTLQDILFEKEGGYILSVED